jgi:hypothetical protein
VVIRSILTSSSQRGKKFTSAPKENFFIFI